MGLARCRFRYRFDSFGRGITSAWRQLLRGPTVYAAEGFARYQQFWSAMSDDGGVICRLHPKVQPYAWGSTTAMTDLLGIPSTGGPMAELWLGDHPLLPSSVAPSEISATMGSSPSEVDASVASVSEADASEVAVPLDEILRADPSTWFDPAARAEGDSARSSLRFLLKVMAIAEPLSLQTHPNKSQAEAGYAREDALGIDRNAPNRNYRDANHKPELICALTEMDALSGFRPVEETIALLALLDDPAARFLISSLAGGLDTALRDGLNGTVFSGKQATASFAEAARNAAVSNPLHALTFGWWAALCDRHPGDGGVAVATLLHCVRLQPGQALFLGAGNMHAYLSGVGIEIMANSDNVLRGGLTPKHVDVSELLHVTNALSGPLPLVMPVDVSAQMFSELDGVSRESGERHQWVGEEWPVPVDDFRLLRISGQSSVPRKLDVIARPLIALCIEGEIRLGQGIDAIILKRGESAIVGTSDSPLSLSGRGALFFATAG